MRLSSLTTTGLLLAGVLLLPSRGSAQPAEAPCPMRARAEGACDAAAASAARPASSRATRNDVAARADTDSLWEGALLGGAVGLGAGATVALLADCPQTRDAGSCASDRAALIALAAALGAGVGLGMDAIIGPEFTGAPLPGPPASERRVGLPPPSSRGAGLRFRLAW
jgi:hypothetical protein